MRVLIIFLFLAALTSGLILIGPLVITYAEKTWNFFKDSFSSFQAQRREKKAKEEAKKVGTYGHPFDVVATVKKNLPNIPHELLAFGINVSKEDGEYLLVVSLENLYKQTTHYVYGINLSYIPKDYSNIPAPSYAEAYTINHHRTITIISNEFRLLNTKAKEELARVSIEVSEYPEHSELIFKQQKKD